MVDRGLVARPEVAPALELGSRVKCGRGLVREEAEGTGRGLERTPISPRASPGGPVAGDPPLISEVLKSAAGQGIPLKLKSHVFCIFVFAGSSQEMGYGFLFLAW